MSVLARLEALLAQATPPPWAEGIEDDREAYVFAVARDQGFVTPRPEPDGEGVTDADAALICGAVNALPALIACARALGETRDELEAHVDCQGTEQNPCPDESGWPCWQCARLTLIDQALARLAEGEPQP